MNKVPYSIYLSSAMDKHFSNLRISLTQKGIFQFLYDSKKNHAIKWTISFLTFTFILFSCEKSDRSIGYDKIELEPFIIQNYSYDAKQLYFHEIYQDSNHVNYNEPIIDNNEVLKILKIIQAVYNSKSPARNIVFEVYQIHGYYCYGFNSVYLKVNTELPEIQNLAANVFPTDELALDNILNSYSFDSVRTSYGYPDFPWLAVYTKEEYNMIPVLKEFEEIESIIIADFSRGCIGDGNNITLKRDNESALITFSIGRGDCPAGCIYRKYWEFKVSNGKARFIRTY